MIDNSNSILRSKSVIKFYDPYIKLQFRASVQDLFLRTFDNNSMFIGVDAIAILDAVLKRGGISKAQQRIQQIYLSLPYYSAAAITHSLTIISKIPAQTLTQLQKLLPVTQQPFVQQHLLPHGHSSTSMGLDQQCFIQENYHSVDQYLCLKTLAYFGCQINRLNSRFINGYYKLRKWMYIHDILMDISTIKEHKIQNKQTHNSKVCIVGINVPNIILALKLRKLGLTAKIVDTNKDNIMKWSKGYVPDTIKQGAFLCTNKQYKQLHELLSAHLQLSVEPINNQKPSSSSSSHLQYVQLPSSSAVQSDILDPLAKHEQFYMALLQQILREWPVNSSKLFWQQIQCKAMAYNNINMDYRYRAKFGSFDKIDIQGLRIYNQRVLMLNRIKDQASATVTDIRKCIMGRTLNTKLNKNSHTQAYMLKSQRLKPKILDQLIHKPQKSSKMKKLPPSPSKQHNEQSDSSSDSSLGFLFKQNFALINPSQCVSKMSYDSVNKVWNVCCQPIKHSQGQQKQKDNVEIFDYLIYTPNSNTNYFDIFPQNSSREINLDYLGNANTQLNCLYKLQQKVVFRGADSRTDSKKLTYACFSGQFGIVHFYVCQDGLHVLACLSCFQNKTQGTEKSHAEYYKQIQGILTNFVLKKGIKIEQPIQQCNQNMQISEYYIANDISHQSSLIRMHQSSRIYISAPIIINNLHESYSNNDLNSSKMDCFNRSSLQAHLEVNRKILHCIINHIQTSLQSQDKRKIREIYSNKQFKDKQVQIIAQKQELMVENQSLQEKQQLQVMQQKQQQKQKQMVDVGVDVNIIPNIQNKSNYDLFGFNTGFVQQYKKVILKSYSQIKSVITQMKPSNQRILTYRRIPQLPLLNQSNYPITISIQPSSGLLLLMNIGLPYKNQNIFIGYRSLRIGFSLSNLSNLQKNNIGLCYHTCLQVNSTIFYCMAEFQINQPQAKQNFIINFVLAHPDYKMLNQAVRPHYNKLFQQQFNPSQDQLRQIQQNLIQIDYDYFDYCLLQYISSFPTDISSCTDKLTKQLSQLSRQANNIPMPIMSSTADSILAQANKYFLKQYTIADLFIGKLNYNLIQFQANLQGRDQIIQNIYTNNIVTNRYPIKLSHSSSQNFSQVTIYRKFMPTKQVTITQNIQNGIYRLVTNKSAVCYQSHTHIYHNNTNNAGNNIIINNCCNWLLQIVDKLLKDRQDKSNKGSTRLAYRHIVRQLKYLAYQQISNFINLLNTLKQSINTNILSYDLYCYLILTRMQHSPQPTINSNSTKNALLQSSSSTNSDAQSKLTDVQIQKLGWMIDQGHVVADNSWFIICHQ